MCAPEPTTIILNFIYEKFLTCVFLADEIENFPNPERRNGDKLNNNSKRKRAVGETAMEHGDEAISRRRLVGVTVDGYYGVCSAANISTMAKDVLDIALL